MHPSLSPAHEAEASRPRARPKLKVVYRRRADLRLDPDNARTHSPEQVEQLAAAMRRWGFTSPILLRDDDATIGAGHGRWEASGLAEIDPVPTITLHGLTDEEWRAYAIADNKLALNAGWDVDRLADQLAALEPELASLTGFSDEQMRELYASVEEATAQLGGVDTSFRYEQQFAVIVACADEAEQQRHFEAVLSDLQGGVIRRQPQDEAFASWEPSWGRAPLVRPDLTLLGRTPEGFTFSQRAARAG